MRIRGPNNGAIINYFLAKNSKQNLVAPTGIKQKFFKTLLKYFFFLFQPEQIETEYKARVRTFHPDKNLDSTQESSKAFQKLQVCIYALSHNEKDYLISYIYINRNEFS